MQTLLYVTKSTSGAFVGKSYWVNLTRVETIEDPDNHASFRPTRFKYLNEEQTKIKAWDSQFSVFCTIVGTREIPSS